MRRVHTEDSEPAHEPLTRRERDVLALLAQGLTSPEIAARLTLATSSVKTHLQHLYGKLGVTSRRQAVARARALGLLPPAGGTPASGQTTTSQQPFSHNLPRQVTQFFGREAEIAAVSARLAQHRLVTLIGPGGIGKTRLSLQVAESVRPAYADGMCLVDLVAVHSPGLVAQQAALALSVQEEPGQPIEAALAAFVGPRQLLLVLDNCEHLIEACAQLAQGLLRGAQSLTILATSREPLGVTGEAIFSVPSLGMPEPARAGSIEAIGRSAAVRLFVDRARLVRPDYQITPTNVDALANICRRLDGIPLAIEMAAARVSLLSAEQVAARLNEAIGFLVGNSRTAPPKHQTLRATLQWSYQLLSEPERLLLRRLSVFAGGCTLEEAEAVCSGDGLEVGQMLDVLASLVSKSMLVVQRRQGEAARFTMLEIVRQFSVEQLTASGETTRLQMRHRNYFLEFAETYAPQFSYNERALWANRLGRERENLRLALQFTFDQHTDPHPVDAGPRLVLCTPAFGFSYPEQTAWSLRAVAWCQSHADISATLMARIQQMFTFTVGMDDRRTPLAWAQQAVEIHRGLGQPGHKGLMLALSHLAAVYIQEFSDVEQGSAALAAAGALFQELGPDEFTVRERWQVEAFDRASMARIANLRGEYAAAQKLSAECLQLLQLAKDDDVFVPLISFGEASYFLEEYEAAEAHFLAALRSTDESDPTYQRTSFALRWLGLLNLARGDLTQSVRYCADSIREALKVPDRNMIASDLGILAGVAARRGQPLRAAQLAGASHALYARQGRTPWEDSTLDTLLPGWRDGTEQAAISRGYAAGQAMNIEAAIAYALGETD